MDNVSVMEVVNGIQHLPDRLGGIFFCELALVANTVEQFSTGS